METEGPTVKENKKINAIVSPLLSVRRVNCPQKAHAKAVRLSRHDGQSETQKRIGMTL